jgi:hypothetical protein
MIMGGADNTFNNLTANAPGGIGIYQENAFGNVFNNTQINTQDIPPADRSLSNFSQSQIEDFIMSVPRDKPISIYTIDNDKEAMAFAIEIRNLLKRRGIRVADFISTAPIAAAQPRGLLMGPLGAEYALRVGSK